MRVLFDELERTSEASRREGNEFTSKRRRELHHPLNWLAQFAKQMGRFDEHTLDGEPLSASRAHPIDDSSVIRIAVVQRSDDDSGVEENSPRAHPRRFRTACANAAEASRPAGTFELEMLPNK